MGTVLFSGGGSGGPSSDDCTATKAQVLSGYTAVTKDSGDDVAEGTMANQGAKTAALNCGASYTIPAGYHNGSGVIRANSLASQTGNATAEDKYVMKGKTYWKDGVLRTGTMETQSAISFSAAALSSNAIRISWKNPASGPWEGIAVRLSGGKEKYKGAGNNPHEANGNNYVDITGLNPNTQYNFICTSYFTGLPDGSSASVSATTDIKTLREIFAPYSSMQYWRKLGSENSNARYAQITPTGDNTFSPESARTSNIIYLTQKQVLIVYQSGANVTHNPPSDEDLRTIEKYSFKEDATITGQNYDLGQITEAKLRTFRDSSAGIQYYAVQITGTNAFSGFAEASYLHPITFYK